MDENHDQSSKLMSAEEAVRRFIKDGDMVALGGFTVNRNPMALAREIIRQGRRRLHLVMHSQGQSMDLLVGAGCVECLELAYAGTGRFAPTGIRFRKAVQNGQVQVEDYSNFHMVLRFLAGALNLPFVACSSGFATDVLKKWGFGPEMRGTGAIPQSKVIESANPFNLDEEPVVLLPPLIPDVALLHVQHASEDGIVRIKGLTFLDIEQARAAKQVIVTCEEVMPSSYLRDKPDQNPLPPFLIDAVVPIPYGAHPTACHCFYDYDPRHLNFYRQAAGDDQAFQSYLQDWVFDVPDQEAYLGKVGITDLMRIKANSKIGYAPALDRR
jgi:glutaconate CoA-transferase subunit A